MLEARVCVAHLRPQAARPGGEALAAPGDHRGGYEEPPSVSRPGRRQQLPDRACRRARR